MILEIAQFQIKTGREADFEAVCAKAAPLFQRAKGCVGMEVQRSMENKGKFVLLVWWETVDNHMKDFRGSEDFQEWRRLIGDLLDGTPQMEHCELVLRGD